MRQIKFRARDLNGYIIYGGISRNGRAIVLDDYGSCAQVDPASIRQLVGVDSNGREVYEGDIVVDKYGEEYTAQLTATLREGYPSVQPSSSPTERFWAERRRYTPLTLKEATT